MGLWEWWYSGAELAGILPILHQPSPLAGEREKRTCRTEQAKMHISCRYAATADDRTGEFGGKERAKRTRVEMLLSTHVLTTLSILMQTRSYLLSHIYATTRLGSRQAGYVNSKRRSISRVSLVSTALSNNPAVDVPTTRE